MILLSGLGSSNVAIAQEYKLVWSEEFDGDSINKDIWNFWQGPAYNNELQFYSSREKNAYLKNGHLYLEAHKENCQGKNYTSARISTDSTRIGWEKGRFEARIKMPEGKGFWPAFWLMPINDKDWPKSGEIDIMEYRGNEPFTTSGAIHFWKEGCTENMGECHTFLFDEYTNEEEKLSDQFYIYALEWTDEELIWYLDGKAYQRIPFSEVKAEFNPFTGPFYIILNLAVGGHFLPNPDKSTEFPQSLVVDYVRVYQK